MNDTTQAPKELESDVLLFRAQSIARLLTAYSFSDEIEDEKIKHI